MSKYIREYVTINRRLEQKWFPKVEKAIKSKVSSLITKVQQEGIEAGKRYLETDIANYQLRNTVEDLYKEAGLRHARRSEIRLRKEVRKEKSTVYYEVKRFGDSQKWIDFILNYLRMFLVEKITFSVNKTTRDALMAVLNDAIQNGWGVTETVKKLDELPFTRYQAARIVRTEINRASNVGIKAQGETFEYETMKEWISVDDVRTRGVNPEDHADHKRMNGQKVDYYDVFTDLRSGNQLDFPGDPKAPPVDTVNCRCQHYLVGKRDENGRLIPKQKRVSVIRNFNPVRRVITV